MKTVTQTTKNSISEAFRKAETDKSKLTELEKEIYGYSGIRSRQVINNICGMRDSLTYLELGSYRGGTLIAAAFRNPTLVAYSVDDFTIDHKEANSYKPEGWSNPRIALQELVEKYKKRDCKENIIRLITSEAIKTDLKLIARKVDIIHYDIETHHADLFNTIKYFLPALDTNFILIVSNWNSQGIRNSYEELGKLPELKIELIESQASHNTGDTNNWYNGISVSLVQKISNK